MSHPIYLDHNATTPILPEVADAVRETALKFGANPASQHRAGQEARRALEAARDRVSELLGANTAGRNADRVVFTSGGTEANNLALLGLLATDSGSPAVEPGHLVASAIEHPSVAGPVDELERQGWRVTRVAPSHDGVTTPAAFASALLPNTRLVVLMAANNETGVVQPVDAVGKLCLDRGIPFFVDAAQWVGKLPIRVGEWNASALSCTAHKFGGPCGIGILVMRHGVKILPALLGGHQQGGLRPGTESVALAVGTQVALECVTRKLHSERLRIGSLRNDFETQVLQHIPSAVVIGKEAERLPNTSNIAFPQVDRQALFLALDMAGVACSTGSACASGSSEPSPVLIAMELEESVVRGSLRFSLGSTTTADEITTAVQRILRCHNHLRSAVKC